MRTRLRLHAVLLVEQETSPLRSPQPAEAHVVPVTSRKRSPQPAVLRAVPGTNKNAASVQILFDRTVDPPAVKWSEDSF